MDKEQLKEIRAAYRKAEAARPWLQEGALSGMAEQWASWDASRDNGSMSGLIPVHRKDLQRFDVDPEEMGDWKKNLRVGVTLLDDMYSQFGDPALALMAMRMGAGRVNDLLDENIQLTDLTPGEREFLPAVAARSGKYGGAIRHDELASLADLVGVTDLARIYKKAGVKPPELPRGAQDVGDGTDANTQTALSQLVGQEEYRDEFTGDMVIGPDESSVLSLFEAPGLPDVKFNRIDRPEILAHDRISPKIAAAFGISPTTKIGSQLDEAIDDLWDRA